MHATRIQVQGTHARQLSRTDNSPAFTSLLAAGLQHTDWLLRQLVLGLLHPEWLAVLSQWPV